MSDRRGGNLLPFVIVTLIWGSTWIVIRDQLGTVPAQWSVTYRFVIASAAMFVIAAATRSPLRLARDQWPLVGALGLFQFCVNFNAVYVAEHHITSGLVATVFALLLIPNSLFAWALLGQRPTARFLVSSAIAIAGIGLLFLQELRHAEAGTGAVLTGIAWTIAGILGASFANVLQATGKAGRIPVYSLLAWAMLIGVVLDGAIAFAMHGPPVIETRWTYWLGLAYLALVASALAFSLYFPLVRRIGPGRAAYSSAIVPIVAMTLSTLFEGYRWTLLSAAGAALAVGGMVLALMSRSSVDPKSAAD